MSCLGDTGAGIVVTTTGTAEELVVRVRGLAAAGYQQLTICLAPGQEHAVEEWARVVARV